MNITNKERYCRPTLARDWFWKYEGVFDYKKWESQLAPLMNSFDWNLNKESGREFKGQEDGRHHKGDHGSRWCELPIANLLIPDIQSAIGMPIYPNTVYIWDYLTQNHLPVHIDSSSINLGKAIAGVIPIVGDFNLKFFEHISSAKPFDQCIYKPGDIILINNTQYLHGGDVLSSNRISLHFYLDIGFSEARKSMSELLNAYIK